MKIYLDLVVFLNFFFDFLILMGVNLVLKNKTRLKRIILGSIIGSLTILVLFIKFNSFTLFIFKFVLSILIIYITFGKKNFIKNISYFYLISIILGGCLYLIDCDISLSNNGFLFLNNGLSLNIFFIIICSPIIIYLYIKENKSYKNNYSNIYNVSIYINNKVYRLNGLLDTGNNLVDPYFKKSIVIVDKSFNIDTSSLNSILVPFRALNSTGMIKCFRTSKIDVSGHIFSDSLIGISNNDLNLNNIDCILPNKYKEDL